MRLMLAYLESIKLHRTARAFFARGDEGCVKFEAETRAEDGAGTSNGTIMDYLYVKNLTLVFHTSPLISAYLRLSPLISAYLRLSRIWGIFWFINSRNENTLTKLNLTKLDVSHLIEIQNSMFFEKAGSINNYIQLLHPCPY